MEYLGSFLRYHFAGKIVAWWHGEKSALFSGFVTVGMFSLEKDMVFDGHLVSCHSSLSRNLGSFIILGAFISDIEYLK